MSSKLAPPPAFVIDGNQADDDDGRQLQKELQPLLDADFDRIVPCHGDVIETGAKSVFEDCFKRFMGA